MIKIHLQRLCHLLIGFLPGLISIVLPRKNDRIIFNSTRNSSYNFNSRYLFEYFLVHHSDLDCKYVINNKKARALLKKRHGDYFISSLSLINIFTILRAGTWVCSSLETPVGGIFLAKNRTVLHLGHGNPLKNIGLLEKKLSPVKFFYYLPVSYTHLTLPTTPYV